MFINSGPSKNTLPGYRLVMVILVLLLTGCAHNYPVATDQPAALYAIQPGEDADFEKYAPMFFVPEYNDNFNRIGNPVLILSESGKEKVTIDASNPVVYTMKRTFTTDRDTYTNYIYRVHFPRIPYRLVPFNLAAGENIGLMVVVTTDSRDRVLLYTTVHTCGCYMAFTPTDLMPADWYPEKWPEGSFSVYGETMPNRVEIKKVSDPVFVAHLRPSVHRVMHVEVVDRSRVPSTGIQAIEMPMEDITSLERLERPDSGFTSLYYTTGGMKGHVKGSWKPLETLFLGIISLDFAVGTDKAYADTEITENPFYTSIKPWNRQKSDMWYFARFLEFWGWNL
jgi:hypothetical protein